MFSLSQDGVENDGREVDNVLLSDVPSPSTTSDWSSTAAETKRCLGLESGV